MNTIDISQGIASFNTENKIETTTAQVSDLIFDIVQPEKSDIVSTQAQYISNIPVITSTTPTETAWISPELRALNFEIVESQTGDIVIEQTQILFTEPKISCHSIKLATAAPKTVSILVPTPVPWPDKDKRRTISTTPSQLRQLRQRIAEVFHNMRVHPCTDGNKLKRICCTEIPLPNAAMNSTVVPQSLSVPNDVETRFSKADDKKTSRSNDKEIIAFVDTQNRGYIVPQSLSVPDDEKTRSVYNTSKTFSKAEDDRIFKANNEEVIAFVDTQNRENIAVKIDVYPAQDKLNKDIQNEDFVEVQTDKVNEFDGTKSRSSTDTARRINITEDETNLIFKQSPYFDSQNNRDSWWTRPKLARTRNTWHNYERFRNNQMVVLVITRSENSVLMNHATVYTSDI
ncbi:hypothetical protein OS493_009529 [Desmophyllum pertusum]|uniref:Uncharacterized protein n=1 Tax=Desmophyllum pertusum TaxID=174260 RepID=A0A9W9Z3B6_9CNID|nr:hypothetical protein OS493_009529 [Desmophyllum pertusum]